MPEHICARFGLLAALLSHACLAALWLGWARWWVVAPLLGMAVAIAFRRRPRLGWTFAILPLAPYAVLYVLHALSPERQADAITYHLHAVAEWLREGRMVERAGFFDVIPHGLETLFTAGASLGGFTAAKLIHFAFLCATIPLIAAVATELGFDGWPAAAIYFMAPVVGVSSTSAYNDAAVAFYMLLTFYLLHRGHTTWAGLAAGFCYAIKMSGAVAPVAVVLWLAVRRRWSAAVYAGVAAAAMMAPWMIRAWMWAGNPLAPMLDSPQFYAEPLASWREFVRWYEVPWRERAWEAVLGGARAQGLAGPAFLLTPVGLLALRKPQGWSLWLAALIAAIPWLLNAGSRFLMPAMIFVALAMAWALPWRVMWGVALVHGALCWPAVMDKWTQPGAWRLEAFLPPAVRFPVAEMVDKHVKPGERVLDFVEAPRAFIRADMFVYWQHASAWRAYDAIRAASQPGRELFYELHGAWPARPSRFIRVEQFSASQDRWSVQEVSLLLDGKVLFPGSSWTLSASHNPMDAPLVFDRNRISRWSPWRPRRDGMFLEVRFDKPTPVDGVRLLCRRDEAGPRVRVSSDAGLLSERLEPRVAVDVNERAAAMRFVRREGFGWILTESGSPLALYTNDWNVEEVDRHGGVVLLRVAGRK